MSDILYKYLYLKLSHTPDKDLLHLALLAVLNLYCVPDDTKVIKYVLFTERIRQLKVNFPQKTFDSRNKCSNRMIGYCMIITILQVTGPGQLIPFIDGGFRQI